MVKRTGPTNIYLRKLIAMLKKEGKKNGARIWFYVAKLLSKPTRNRVEVNLYKINKYSKDGETILVPGKVLGVGYVSKNIKIAAWKFSNNAIEKLSKNNIKIMNIEELVKENPKGSNVRILI